jgi:hypothetical protein
VPGPRAAQRAVAAIVLVAAAVAAVSVGAAGARELHQPSPGASEHVRRVLVLSLPGTTWAALSRSDTPHLDALLARAAVGSTSVRGIKRETRTGDGYVTIGAGTAAAGVRRVEGLADNGPGGVVSRARPELADDAERRHRGAEIGALGESLAEAGVARAVIANADTSLEGDDPTSRHREAALALADRHGIVPAGVVDRRLLRADPAAPFGVSLDPDRAVEAFREAWDVPGRAVVVFEASDLARLHISARQAGGAVDAALLDRTLRATDELAGRLLETVDERDAVVLTAPSDPGDGIHLTVGALRAPGRPPGLLDSATTRRAGYVTLPDLGPTVLDLLDITRPDSMEGRPYEIHPRSWAAPPLERFAEADREARFRDRMLGPVAGTYVVIEILLSLLVTYVLVRHPGWTVLRGGFDFVGLWLLAVVPLTFLGAVLDLDTVGPYLALVVGGGVILAAGAAALRGTMQPLALLLGLLLALHVGDVVTGSHLQLSTVFGYSPTVGGRFAGFGNLTFGQVAAGSVLLAGIIAYMVPGRRGVRIAGAVLVVALLADGLPFWGADVGGVLAAVPAFALVALGLSGRTVSRRSLVALAAGGVAVVCALGFVDLLRPAESRTHLGRLFEQIGSDGIRPFTDAVQRKIATNLSVIPTSIWIPLVPAVLGFYAWLAYGSSFRLREIKGRAPQMRPAFVGLLVAAALGLALNDSGVAIPAMMLGVLNPVLVRLALHTDELGADRSAAGPSGEAPRPESQGRAVDESGAELRVGEARLS